MIQLKIILGMILLFNCSTSIAKALYTYSSGWLAGEKYYVHRNNDESLVLNYGGDERNKVTQCVNDSEYYCFFTRRLAFVFPKNITINTSNWVVRDITFELIESNKVVRFLGKEITGVFLIKTPYIATLAGRQHKKDTYWLYSKTYGVLGFGYKAGNRVYWLEQEKGLGVK